MRSSEHHRRFAARLLPLLAAIGVLVPGYLFAAPGSPGEDVATRQLFNAVQTNDFQAVQSSVAAGADVEARNPWGSTAADVAVDKGYFRIAHYLVSIRNFQRPKAEPPARTAPAVGEARSALIQASPPAPSPALPAASARASKPTPTAPVKTAPAPSDRGTPVVSTTAAGGAEPFDPARPAYGAVLPAGNERF